MVHNQLLYMFHKWILMGKPETYPWGCLKTRSPFKWCFHTLSFFVFPRTVFPSAGFTPWSKNSYERGKGKGKGRVKERKEQRKGKGEEEGKGKEKEKEKDKIGSVSHGPFLMPKVIVFVIVLLLFVNPLSLSPHRLLFTCMFLFLKKWLQSSKKDCSDHLAGTFLVQNLTRICWRANITIDNERKIPKALYK